MLLLPAHVAFLEIVIDPTSCFVFESEKTEKNIMTKPPRPRGESIFSFQEAKQSLVRGGIVLSVIGGFYGALAWQGLSTDEIRTAVFSMLVLAGAVLVAISLDRRAIDGVRYGLTNRFFLVITGVSVLMLALVIVEGNLRGLFRFAAPSAQTLMAVLLATGIAFAGLMFADRLLAKTAVRP